MESNLKINPLQVFNIRRVKTPPIHFEYADVAVTYNLQDAVERWIDNNLKGRYFVGKGIVLDQDNKIEYSIRVGFEDTKELSFFMLACPHLKYK